MFLEVAVFRPGRLKKNLDSRSQPFFKALVGPTMCGRRGTAPFLALVDTGATSTGITKAVVKQVGLSQIGQSPVRSVSGVQTHNRYRFQIGLPSGISINKDGTGILRTFYMIYRDIEGIEFFDHDDFDVLLGMDILSIGSLKVEGNGTFSFSF